MSIALDVRDLTVRFGATIALNRVGCSVSSGQVLALVGENGSGKSTASKVVAGIVRPQEGSMTLNGSPYLPGSPADARTHGVAMIHQELALCPHLTVGENIALGAERSIRKPQAKAALERLGYGSLSLDRLVGELPPASRQIVEVARAIASQAKVLIFDEPTSSLTAADAAHLFDVVESLRDAGHAIIYISHFLEEIERLASQIVILRDGEKVAQADRLTRDEMVTLMVGREIAELYPRGVHAAGADLLDVRDLSGRAKPERASFTLRRGEVFGIAGLNGAGRTEVLRTIFGLDPTAGGTVTYATFAGPAAPPRRWQQGMGMLSEDRKEEGLALGLTIADNLTLPSLPSGVVRSRSLDGASQPWIERLAIRCQGPAQPVGALSGGNQQKVALARLLYKDVDCLLLDEPTRGIDVGSKRLIYEIIDEAAKSGKAVLVVSSYLPELLGVCDRIAVMRRGRLGPARPVSETTAESLLAEALGVEDDVA